MHWILILLICLYPALSLGNLPGQYSFCFLDERDFIINGAGANNRPAFSLTKFQTTPLALRAANFTLLNYTNITLGNYTELSGFIGYCGSPIAINGEPANTFTESYTLTHHINIILPIPWCFTTFSFGGFCGIHEGVYSPYLSYFGPPVITNERPLQPECLNYYGKSNDTSFQPPFIPLWDQGGETLGTMRIMVNDSCFFNSSITKSVLGFYFILTNGNFIVANDSGVGPEYATNITNTTSRGHYLYAGYAETTIPGATTGKYCSDASDLFPQPYCYNSPRTTSKRDYFRSRSVVSLACKDTIGGFGFVWRVENIYSFNTHFDWYLTDAISGTLLSSIPNTNSTNNLAFNFSKMTSSRNVGFNDGLFNGFWPGVAGKRRVAANQFFYIPTYSSILNLVNQTSSINNTVRPSILDLYAGWPSHYVGSTNLAGFVDFFDSRTILNMTALIQFNVSSFSFASTVSPSRNATYIDKNSTQTIRFNSKTMDLYVVKDYERQLILAVCRGNNSTIINEVANVTRVNGWITLCSHMNNNSKTWNETLLMIFQTFPGVLSSPSDDPIPVCNCSNITRSPCGSDGIVGLPNMMKQYNREQQSLVVNASVGPICKMNNDTLDKIYKTIQSNSSLAVNIYKSIAFSNGGDYGYVWKIENKNIGPLQIPGLTPTYTSTGNDLYTRWAIGNQSNGPPLPYPLPNGLENVFSPSTNTTSNYATHDVTIRSGTIFFFFSMTSNPHKMYGTFQQICVQNCSSFFPVDPPSLADPFGWSVNGNSSFLTSLPDCVCGVHLPCQLGKLLFNVDSTLNFSALKIAPAAPLPPIHYDVVSQDCIPTVEICNGLDDDCNGEIDDIPGFQEPCGEVALDGIGICVSGAWICPDFFAPNTTLQIGHSVKPVCFGLIQPSPEICNGIDDDCDGFIDNISPNLCGSRIGTCEFGITQCNGINVTQVDCVGGITPIAEICGDGLDNDCDGVVDNGCITPFSLLSYVSFAPFVTQNHNPSLIAYSINGDGKKEFTIPNGKFRTQDNSIKVKEVTNEDMFIVMSALTDLADYFTTLYTILWTALLVSLAVCLVICCLCAFGPTGGCWFCCYANSETPWDTYSELQNNQTQSTQT